MNLLIEQRSSSIPSSNTQSESLEKSNDNDLNNSSSTSSSLVLKIKRNATKQQTNDSISRSSSMAEDDDDDGDNRQSTRSSIQNSRLKRPNSITSTRRPSSPAFNGKQQQQHGTKRSVTIDNNNNDLPSHLEEVSARKRFKPDECNQSSSSKVDASVETVSVGLATEPDHLGPCEPGTSVVLEGIVWNETDSGVLVVNVTWRGKTYVGTLLDSTKQDWACPRLTCDSPTSDLDGRNITKSSRSKRTSAGANTRSSTQNQSVSSFQQITSIILSSGIDDRRLRNNIKSRQSKRINQLSMSNVDEITNSGSPLASPHRTNQSFFSSETTTTVNNGKGPTNNNVEPQLIPCSESNCHKRFTSKVALSYHLSNAHPKASSTSNTISQTNTRDEEDVAHILANVAHYARRSSPPSSVRSSPEHTSTSQTSPNLVQSPNSNRNQATSSLTWPCQQISSKLVQPAALINDEQLICSNSIRSPLATNILETNPSIEQDDLRLTINSTDSKIVRRQEELKTTSPVSILQSNQSTLNSSIIDQNHNNRERQSSPIPSTSTFVPITLPATIPPTSSSPAYSDISDEDPTTVPHEQMLPPSTINLLASTNGKLDVNGSKISTSGFLPSNGGLNHPDLSNPAWTTQILLQQFGSYITQSGLALPATSIVSTTTKEPTKGSQLNTPNGLNSKTSCPSTNGSNDSTVKNILDTRRATTMKSSTSPPMNLYHFHSNGTSIDSKYSPSIINTLTSPNENLLHLSNLTATTTAVTPATSVLPTLKPMDILDFSLNPSHTTTSNGQYPHSSSLHPSR